jgi:hypothetical protein
VIDQLVRDGYAVMVVCEVLDYPRSTYYHTAKPVTDVELRAAIREVAGQWPRYGYRSQAHPTLDAADAVAPENQGKKATHDE